MARLEIIDVPHPTLKKIAVEVSPKEINDNLRGFVADMIETMLEAPGVGLAAPQVNVSKRILVVDVSAEYPDRKPFALINPMIVEKSGDSIFEEGCLSIPEFRADIKRAKKIKVEYLDEWGKTQSLEDDGFLAVVIQHELDHLNGITMLDHVSPMKRMMYLKKLKKRQRKAEEILIPR
jgi:peptide deformylase